MNLLGKYSVAALGPTTSAVSRLIDASVARKITNCYVQCQRRRRIDNQRNHAVGKTVVHCSPCSNAVCILGKATARPGVEGLSFRWSDYQTRERSGSDNGRSACETVIVITPVCGAIGALIHRTLRAQCTRNEWKINRVAKPGYIGIVC